MAMLPQDPLLISGSVRENLDPERKYDDARLWEVLESVQLKAAVSALEGGLDYVIDDGDSLSRGQRQLLCLGRAILLDRPVVIIDEATSSIDSETEAIVQNVLKTVCVQKTVIAIAHRTGTVAGMSDG